jgi:hypothetical protein
VDSEDYICGAFFLLLLWPPFVSPSALCSVTSPQGDSHTHPLTYSIPLLRSHSQHPLVAYRL